MTREFIITKEFDQIWKNLGLTDSDLSELQAFLCENPDVGDHGRNCGCKKIAVGPKGTREKWRSEGCLFGYSFFRTYIRIYLITVFPKNEKANLSKQERNAIKTLVLAIKKAERELKK